MTATARCVLLAERPRGGTGREHLVDCREELPSLSEGEVLVHVSHLSLAPAMRGWLNDVRSYMPPVGIGEVMRAFGTATVLSPGILGSRRVTP